MYLIRIGRAYRTYYRYTKPYLQAWKYKKDLIDMQKLIDRDATLKVDTER